MNDQPKFLLKHWVRDRKGSAPTVRYSVFSDEDHLIKFLRTVYGNYYVFNVGGEYKPKSYFDQIFADEVADKEREKYEELKKKFENGEK